MAINEKIQNFENKVHFPFLMLDIKKYNFVKAIASVIFVAAIIFFIDGLLSLLNWSNTWWRPDSTVKILYFLYHLLVFTAVYCFTWIVFDRSGAEGFALALFTTVLGIIYIFSPIDFVPDPIPIIGSFDDLLLGGLLIFMGIFSWKKAMKKHEKQNHLAMLIHKGEYEKALFMLMESQGSKKNKLFN
jgi:hypothetical protein